MDQETRNRILTAQKNEITEYLIYKKLAAAIKEKNNSEVLEKISQEELKHHNIWRSFTNETVKPDGFKIFFYVFISRVFGLSFGIKLMEAGEGSAQAAYDKLKGVSAQVEGIIEDEVEHEKALIDLINEERLMYVSSMVLGLNDALVELSGALAGFTLALQNTRLIAMVGLVTGIAASMSMAASEYLSTRQEETEKNPVKASVYTGIAYILTVLFLIFPYLIFSNVFASLALMLGNVILVILIFTFYISVAKDLDFKRRFLEMASISLGVAAISFLIGLAVRKVFGVDV